MGSTNHDLCWLNVIIQCNICKKSLKINKSSKKLQVSVFKKTYCLVCLSVLVLRVSFVYFCTVLNRSQKFISGNHSPILCSVFSFIVLALHNSVGGNKDVLLFITFFFMLQHLLEGWNDNLYLFCLLLWYVWQTFCLGGKVLKNSLWMASNCVTCIE